MRNAHLSVRHILVALLALAVFAFLLRQVEWRQIPQTLARAPRFALLVGFVAYGVFVLTKAWRFQLLLGLPLPLRRLFPIVAFQTFWTNVLPMRTGDLSYVYLLRRQERVSTSKGMASLILGSVLDVLLLLGLLVGLGGLFYGRFRDVLSITTLFGLPVALALGMLGFLGLACLFHGRIEASLQVQERPPTVERPGRLQRGLALLRIRGLQLAAELTTLPTLGRTLGIVGVSALSMALRFAFQWYLIRAMQIPLSLAEVSFALAFTGFCNLLPIQSVGGLGTVEAPWTWALVGLGIPTHQAVLSGISLHLIVLAYSGGIGLLGWCLTRLAQAA